MLTFEEFSAKKKIDLIQFSQAEPMLYAEFKSEYEQMGEKSFDHSKKFLFNKIRRAYHVKEEPKLPKSSVESIPVVLPDDPNASSSIGQKPTYMPKFKAKASSEEKSDVETSKVESSKLEVTEEKPKQAYQPRFKMPSTIQKQDEKSQDLLAPKGDEEIKSQNSSYKPRFKANAVDASLSSKQQTDDTNPQESHPEAAKPAAYKPKFNLKHIKPKE